MSLLMLVFSIVSTMAQTAAAPGKNVKWQTFSSKNEFSIAMPESTKGFTEDNDYFLGRGMNNRVSKRIVMSVLINGTTLITEVYEGDVRDVRDELIKRLSTKASTYDLVKAQDVDGVSLKLFQRKQDKLFSIQQFVLFKKRLYVLQAHAGSEKDLILEQFKRSLALSVGGKNILPNLSSGEDEQSAIKPPDIIIDSSRLPDDSVVLSGKPDREMIMLYKPLPRYTSEARQAGATGEVILNVLFSASGKVTKIKFESGELAFRESSVSAAERILFVPAEKDGKLVSVWKKISYSFAIF